MPPRVLAGASGYSYAEWNGVFYPPKLKPAERLAYYAERLPTVEINSSFYALPRREVAAGWADSVPAAFRFSLKAPGAITHKARLGPDVSDDVAALYRLREALGEKAGPVLFQLPPNLRQNLARLRAFLQKLPAQHAAAFEFRHDSWYEADVYAALAEAEASFCISEREDATTPPLTETTTSGYLRLRREHYTPAELAE